MSLATAAERAAVSTSLRAGVTASPVNAALCGSRLESIKAIQEQLPEWTSLVRTTATACFSKQSLSTSNNEANMTATIFYSQYIATFAVIEALPDTQTSDLVAFITASVTSAREADAAVMYYSAAAHGAQALAAAAVLAGSHQDAALKDALSKALSAALQAQPVRPNELRQRADLMALRQAAPWVKLIGFSSGMLTLAELAPTAKTDLKLSLEGVKSAIMDPFEQDNLDELITAIAAN